MSGLLLKFKTLILNAKLITTNRNINQFSIFVLATKLPDFSKFIKLCFTVKWLYLGGDYGGKHFVVMSSVTIILFYFKLLLLTAIMRGCL